jgi:nitrogenase iron protein NifH
MRKLAFYGKGGIGKSTIVSNLARLFARDGKRVLLFGCDPKSDSGFTLVPGRVRTVMDEWVTYGEAELSLSRCLMTGPWGVDVIEAGGPQPGSGCGGRAITTAFEMVGDPDKLAERYDVVLFDVLGDVVCGGFSAPMRSGYADEVYVVTSGEFRALYAANNISQAIRKNSRDGARMGGLIANLRNVHYEKEQIEELAKQIGSSVLYMIPRDPTVNEAERKRVPLVDFDPACPAAEALVLLHARISTIGPDDLHIPKPLPRDRFEDLFLRNA